MSVFGLRSLKLVVMKALLLFYNMDLLSICEAYNEKELGVFENAASSGPFYFLYNMPIFR